jgi:hypothetical protein
MLNAAASLYELQDHYDDRNHEQNMDQIADGRTGEAET